ncbi:hypothetical protein M434DRAFT_37195 [Hypoxylon sp. CO27-5]|nr:hypothetical protein M434DRAFT_37195 [Hypoxylon sp. CO27-5]
MAGPATKHDQAWSRSIEHITRHLVTELLEEEKAISFGEDFDKDKLLQVTNRVLGKLVIPFGELQKKRIEEQLTSTQRQLEKLVATKATADDMAKRLRTELENTEASYSRQLQEMTKDHHSSLTKADEEISSQTEQITQLKEQVSTLRHDLNRKLTSEDTEAYISELEANYEKFKKSAEELQKSQDRSEKKIKEQETQLERERLESRNHLRQFQASKKELEQVRGAHVILNQTVQALQEQKHAVEQKAKGFEEAVKAKDIQIVRLSEELQVERRSRTASLRSTKSSAASSRELGGLHDEIESARKDEMIDDLEDEVVELKKQNRDLMDNVSKARNESVELQKQQKAAEEARRKVEERVKILEREASKGRDQAAGDANKFKKERDELRGQLKKANDKNDDNVKEIRRLKQSEEKIETLQKRERELQSELKLRAQEIKRAEEKVKRAEQEASSKSNTQSNELNSQIQQCERERSDLEKRVEELTRQLERERNEHDAALGNNPSDHELRELRHRLRQAEDDLREERAARLRLEVTIRRLETTAAEQRSEAEAKVKALTADFENRLAKSNTSRDDLAEYFKELFGNLLEHSREVQADLETHTKLSRATRDSYLDRISQMSEQVKSSPGGPEANLTRRRLIGVEKEVERMNGIIDALTAENDWFRDVNHRFSEGQQRLVQIAEEAKAEAATANEQLTAAQAAAAAAAKAPASATIIQNPITSDRAIWFNILTCVVLSGIFVAIGREYGAIKAVNQPAKRAIYINSVDRHFCFKIPTYEFMWEFVLFALAGVWKWKA